MRILIVEDEKYLAMVLTEMLTAQGYYTDESYNGEDGLDNALSGIYDLIILDVMLPKMNGFDVLREIRRNKVKSAVLMLTARSTLEDKVTGLEYGADDYLTKPFETKELLARVKALGRRKHLAYVDDNLQFADITLNCSIHEMNTEYGRIKLSKKEFDIIELMISNKGKILSKEQLIIKIWGYDSDLDNNSIEVYIHLLRKKLSAIKSNVKIATVRGLGYTLEVDKNGK